MNDLFSKFLHRAEPVRVHAACFHFPECLGRAHRAHILRDTKLHHAADFFCNNVQMVWPSFAEHHTRALAGSESPAPHVRAAVEKAFSF